MEKGRCWRARRGPEEEFAGSVRDAEIKFLFQDRNSSWTQKFTFQKIRKRCGSCGRGTRRTTCHCQLLRDPGMPRQRSTESRLGSPLFGPPRRKFPREIEGVEQGLSSAARLRRRHENGAIWTMRPAANAGPGSLSGTYADLIPKSFRSRSGTAVAMRQVIVIGHSSRHCSKLTGPQ